MAARSTSRFKQKPAVPFGDFMLPILGVIALGIVVVGIRILWAPTTPKPTVVPQPRISQSQSQSKVTTETAVAQPVVTESTEEEKTVEDVVIAQPIQRNGSKAQTTAKPVPVKETVTATPKTQEKAQQKAQQKAQPKHQTVTKIEPKKETPRSQAGKTATVKAGSIDKSRYIIQCGSYTDNAAANSVVASLKKSGYSAVIRKADVRGKTYYRVIVAGGSDRSVADTIARDIKSAGHPVLVRENK